MNYKKNRCLMILSVIALSACAPVAPAPAQPKAPEPTIVHVKLSDFKIELDRNTIPVGDVKFEIQNTGVVSHEMIIELPSSNDVALTNGNDKAEAEAIDPGKTGTLIWKLDKAGMYHLSCHNNVNNIDHFKTGMMIPITVTTS